MLQDIKKDRLESYKKVKAFWYMDVLFKEKASERKVLKESRESYHLTRTADLDLQSRLTARVEHE